MIDLEVLEILIEEYLLTLSVTDGEDWYDNYRGFAKGELGKFLEWLQDRGDEGRRLPERIYLWEVPRRR